MIGTSANIKQIRQMAGLSQERLARLLEVSYVSISKWERGASEPSLSQSKRITDLLDALRSGVPFRLPESTAFAARGASRAWREPGLFDVVTGNGTPAINSEPGPPILERIARGSFFLGDHSVLSRILSRHKEAAPIASTPPFPGVTAGKNTYTYDAHTYHTKVPPQGIAELLRQYLPMGGLVLDPFAGSGMTGVAARALGYDCILNELSPAACFIAREFLSRVDPRQFRSALDEVLRGLAPIRKQLYHTSCRDCGKETELGFMVWSYRVQCNHCGHDFLLWDHCRQFGRTVREHKILSEFECPGCGKAVKKSLLQRTISEPVEIGYTCCRTGQQEVPPNEQDLGLAFALELSPPLVEGFYPNVTLPDGVNLRQPKRHGILRLDQFYTPRNLAALSHLWRAIHTLVDPELAAALAFTFTSLYQRVTRLSEFRFWGGSGNSARFNVPFIFNEANVFVTFERKARTILDHLETTAVRYAGDACVVRGSATSLGFLPDASVDLVFTDPPFGANINYSEMNILWEAWLGEYTDTTDEVIVNRTQGKDVAKYEQLMTASLTEAFRVLRPGGWMLLVFMNSSASVWHALRAAVLCAGFEIDQVGVFDKEHGTFKQFVSDNTAGADLILHCRKAVARAAVGVAPAGGQQDTAGGLAEFLSGKDLKRLETRFLHVERDPEVDMRMLYSEWTALALARGSDVMDFVTFRFSVNSILERGAVPT